MQTPAAPSGLGRLVGPRASWVTTLVAALVAAAVAFAYDPTASEEPDASANLPVDAESFDAARIDADLNPESLASAVVVFARGDGALTAADRADLDERSAGLLADVPAEARDDLVVSDDGRAALLRVPVADDFGDVAGFVSDLRRDAADGLPDGVTSQVTGGTAITEDQTVVATSGADPWVLGVLALAAVALLLWIGRHPLAWLAAAAVVGVADRVTAQLLALATQLLPPSLDSTTGPLATLLVVGVGAGQVVLLTSAHRAALREQTDHHAAMRTALARSGRTVLVSTTVAVAALLLLLLADNPATQAVAYAGAIGVLVTSAATLLVLPAVLTLAGRWTYWGSGDPGPGATLTSTAAPAVGSRAGSRVGAPAALGVVAVVAVALASPLLGARLGLAQAEQFLETPDSVAGQRTVAAHFPAGLADPLIVTAPSDAGDAVADAVRRVDGVASVDDGGSGDGTVVLDAAIDRAPGRPEGLVTVEQVRDTARSAEPEALVGGVDAELLDARDAAGSDQLLLVPAVAGVALLLLVALTRSLLAPVAATVALLGSWAAALGVGWLLLSQVVGYAAYDLRVPLLALVALAALATPSAVAATTAPTVALPVLRLGLLLAVVALAVGALPLVTLTQVGVVVAVGGVAHQGIVRGLGDVGTRPARPARGG